MNSGAQQSCGAKIQLISQRELILQRQKNRDIAQKMNILRYNKLNNK